jgi:hypothetical protein
MAFRVAIPFPSEAEALRKLVRAELRMTPMQRWAAVVDVLATAEVLSRAGGVREAQLKYQQGLEEEWRRRMREFIKHHVAS